MIARAPERSRRPVTMEIDPTEPHPILPSTGATLCDRYRLDAVLARGASAVVWRGTDLVLGEVVAIKLLLPDGVFATPEARAGRLDFRQEAVSAMRLGHPAILRVFNYERHGELEFLVMELVVGEPLSELVRRRPQRRLSVLETIQIGLECLDGLGYAHGAGVIHNDIKPSNLIMTRAGAIKICDFGLARLTSTAGQRRVIAGTPGFMSPEILAGHSGDIRSDLFSLAATLYALGNGRLMLPRDRVQASRWQRAPRSLHLPLIVDEVLAVATALDPRDRFQSAAEMKTALEAVRGQVQDLAPESSPSPAARATAAALALELPFAPPAQVEGEPTDPAGAPPLVADDGDMIAIGARTLRSAHGGVVDVPAFRLDRTPVTNEAYAAFVRATGVLAPAHWLGMQPPAQRLRHPVVGVSLDEARAFAAWRGVRLPTSAEWEAAARGPAATAFPWGDAFEPGRCRCPEAGAEGTAAVDAHAQGATAEGVLDLVGNVWEWTEADARLALPSDGFAWVFGGSYRHPCSKDGQVARAAVAEGHSYHYLGFRCATAIGQGER